MFMKTQAKWVKSAVFEDRISKKAQWQSQQVTTTQIDIKKVSFECYAAVLQLQVQMVQCMIR